MFHIILLTFLYPVSVRYRIMQTLFEPPPVALMDVGHMVQDAGPLCDHHLPVPLAASDTPVEVVADGVRPRQNPLLSLSLALFQQFLLHT